MDQEQVRELRRRVDRLKEEAQRLAEEGSGFPALKANAARVLASVRMMELNLPVPSREPAESHKYPRSV